MDEQDKPGRSKSIFHGLAGIKKREEKTEGEKPPVELAPAMTELGTAPCPVCQHEVAVFLTRTKRPFLNCSYCSARIFYNGSRCQELLKKQLRKAGYK